MNKHLIIKIIYSFLLFVLSQNSFAQKNKTNALGKPKLIVSIVIEGMRYDYLYRWQNNFEANGFNLLMQKGAVCENAEYNYLFTQTSTGMATITTGCEPSTHGIIADEWYKRINNKMIKSIYDPRIHDTDNRKSGYSYSPHLLQTTTFSDELKLFNNNKSKVISLSLDSKTAVMGGGQLANAAYWFNTKTGKFTTSSYYLDSMPKWVNDFNAKGLSNIYLQNQWQPLLANEKYINSEKDLGYFAKYTQKYKSQPYDKLTLSPYGISLTKDFAISAISNNNLGKSDFTDYINICFTAPANVNKTYGTNSKELEDIYLRLDRELAHLLKFLDEYIGKNNILLFLTSTHGAAYNPKMLKKQGVSAGEFDGSRASTLLQTYLTAIYGKGKWITAYHNKQIYLNRNLIEDSSLDLVKIQEQSALFLTQFTGVANAITSSTLEKTQFSRGVFLSMQNSYNQKRSGDVIINLLPSWKEKIPIRPQANSAYKYDTHVPLIWYGNNIKSKNIAKKINITNIAPTISYLLKIPAPNGSTGKPIVELIAF